MRQKDESGRFTANAIEASIRIGLIALLVVWCFRILEPFLIPVLWGLVLAIALHPVYRWLEQRIGHRRKTAATIIAATLVLFIVAAGALVAGSLFEGVAEARTRLDAGVIIIPPPPAGLADVPVIGPAIARIWSLAMTNIDGLFSEFAPQMKDLAIWVLEAAAGAGFALLIFLVSTIIAGVFLATSEGGANFAREIGRRIVGERGDEFVADTEQTIRSVVSGILGVAVIQSLMAGIGFVVAGVPGAGFWTLLCVILAVMQVGIGPIAIPVAFYMFYTSDTLTATLLAVWLLLALVSDNILKPILLGRKAPVPMLVIFLGSIGGFLASGIIGLFVGAVVLSLGYKLFLAWLKEA